MSACTTRQDAPKRVMGAFIASLDRIIPADESGPLKGSTFLDWENQVAQMRRAVMPTILKKRSALERLMRRVLGWRIALYLTHTSSSALFNTAAMPAASISTRVPIGSDKIPANPGRAVNTSDTAIVPCPLIASKWAGPMYHPLSPGKAGALRSR